MPHPFVVVIRSNPFDWFCSRRVCFTTKFTSSLPSEIRLALGKVRYGIYDPKRERVISVVLRKSHLRSKIHHRVLDIDIFERDESKSIGRIYPYSTHLERSEYGPATAMKGEFAKISIRRNEDDSFSSLGDESGNQSHSLDRCTCSGRYSLLRITPKWMSLLSVVF